MTISLDAINNANSIGWADASMSRSAANRIVVGSSGPTIGVGGLNLLGTGDRLLSACNGAASLPPAIFTGAWFTGGSTTTTKPQVLIEVSGATSNSWSTAGTGLGVNAASGFTGNLIDLKIDGSSKFNIAYDGSTTLATDRIFTCGSIDTVGYVKIQSTLLYGSFGVGNLIEMRNGTNAQTFRIYNTYTDASNYERGGMRWNSNVWEIGTEAGGTGTVRPTLIGAATTRMKGLVSSAAAPTTTELTTDTHWCIHKNTTSGVVSLAYNDSGTIYKRDAYKVGELEHPYMGLYFSTPALTTITTATEYVKVAGTTSTSNISSTMSTDSVDNRIKYTGTVMAHFHVVSQASVTLSAGTNQDIGIQVWKYDSSGAAGTLLAHSEARTTIAGTDVMQITTHADAMLDENDYIEMHIANHTNTNDVTVEFGYMFAVGMPHS